MRATGSQPLFVFVLFASFVFTPPVAAVTFSLFIQSIHSFADLFGHSSPFHLYFVIVCCPFCLSIHCLMHTKKEPRQPGILE
ncbi:hypothetical protein HDV62DRAFT_173665 [Trichoderma sp. SZMC 28011]